MRIELEKVAKRYRNEWILRRLNLQLSAEHSYAISGPNGSGKSTLLKILSGYLTPTRGNIHFYHGEKRIESNELYRYLSFAAPYIELIEEFSLLEALQFHQQFQPLLPGMTTEEFIELLGLPISAQKKVIRYYSSGMKQRVKLALGLCADAPLVLLDEPTTNLDRQGMDWYRSLVEQFVGDRLLIIASNVEEDFDFCSQRINILDYK